MLQATKAKIVGPKGPVVATILLDSGSDRTYITSSLVKRLGLHSVDSIVMNYSVFGGGKSNSCMRNVHQFTVEGLNDGQSISISGVEMPVICSTLSKPSVPAKCAQYFYDSHGISLVDSSVNEPLKVDILIGLDSYWDIVTGKVIRMPGSNLVAQETILGWVLSGSVDVPNPNQGVVCSSVQLFSLSNTLTEKKVIENVHCEPETSCDSVESRCILVKEPSILNRVGEVFDPGTKGCSVIPVNGCLEASCFLFSLMVGILLFICFLALLLARIVAPSSNDQMTVMGMDYGSALPNVFQGIMYCYTHFSCVILEVVYFAFCLRYGHFVQRIYLSDSDLSYSHDKGQLRSRYSNLPQTSLWGGLCGEGTVRSLEFKGNKQHVYGRPPTFFLRQSLRM